MQSMWFSNSKCLSNLVKYEGDCYISFIEVTGITLSAILFNDLFFLKSG